MSPTPLEKCPSKSPSPPASDSAARTPPSSCAISPADYSTMHSRLDPARAHRICAFPASGVFRMKLRLLLSVVFSVISVAISASPSAAQEESRKPNIVFILADDLGIHDLGCY